MRVSVLPSKHQRFVPATGGSALRGSLHSERPTVGGCGGHGGSRSPRERQDERRDLRIEELALLALALLVAFLLQLPLLGWVG